MTDFAQSRTNMVDNQLRTNDVTDLRILDAMGEIPRERFVPASKQVVAYIDEEVPVDSDARRFLMKPHIFGKLVQLARISSDDVVLVVGAATGYAVAVAARLAQSVVAVEEDAALAARASELMGELGVDNAAVITGKLSDGCASEGPYDVILIDGAVGELPKSLLEQLRPTGRLVVIEGKGGAAQARLYQASGTAIAPRFGFNAATQALPGFEKEAGFVF